MIDFDLGFNLRALWICLPSKPLCIWRRETRWFEVKFTEGSLAVLSKKLNFNKDIEYLNTNQQGFLTRLYSKITSSTRKKPDGQPILLMNLVKLWQFFHEGISPEYQALTKKGIQIELSIENAVRYPRILSISSSLARDSVTLCWNQDSHVRNFSAYTKTD